MRREWIEMSIHISMQSKDMSPSMRREWIEIGKAAGSRYPASVSLHAEGVD